MAKSHICDECYDIARGAADWYGRIKDINIALPNENKLSESVKDFFEQLGVLDGPEPEGKELNEKDKMDLAMFLSLLEYDDDNILKKYNISLDSVFHAIPQLKQIASTDNVDDNSDFYQDLFKIYIKRMTIYFNYVNSSALTMFLLNPNYSSPIIGEIVLKSLGDKEYLQILASDVQDKFRLETMNFYESHPDFKREIEKEIEQEQEQELPPIIKILQGRQVGSKEQSDGKKLGYYLTDKKYVSDPAIGRKKEINSTLVSLITKSAMLIGPSGVGKTAIVDGIAYRLQRGMVPKVLKDYKVLKVNVNDLVAGTSYRGEFEEKVKSLISRLQNEKNVILFIDEIHAAKGAGSAGGQALDLLNILKPYLSDGDIRMIGATTNSEYDEYFYHDDAFRRRFDKIVVNEPKYEQLMEIAKGSIPKYEVMTGVYFNFNEEEQEKIFSTLIQGSSKGVVQTDRQYNPSLMLTLLEKSFAYAAFNNHDSVSVDDICESISSCERLYGWQREKTVTRLRSRFAEQNKAKSLVKEPHTAQIIQFRPRREG